MFEISLDECDEVGGGFLRAWAAGEALNQALKYIFETAQSSTGGNSDISSWGAA